jgi:NAD-dependent SIR2 family protein deacetylase
MTGAGISVAAGIPDFRSTSGIFNEIRQRYRGSGIKSGKDLFSLSVFQDPSRQRMHFEMMGMLARQSQQANPTAIHQLFKALDIHGSLLRVYTQNIDRLEAKAGLSFDVAGSSSFHMPGVSGEHSHIPPSYPRCIPLHGDLGSLKCIQGGHIFPMANHIEQLATGESLPCPKCQEYRDMRIQMGKRSLGQAPFLRPNVLLYGEVLSDYQSLDMLIQKDLNVISHSVSAGHNPVLLVIGTSLKVPGTIQLVTDIHAMLHNHSSAVGMEAQSTRTICVDIEFPNPHSKWSKVFDIWVCGDAQVFAQQILDRLLRPATNLSGNQDLTEQQNCMDEPSIDVTSPNNNNNNNNMMTDTVSLSSFMLSWVDE